MSFLLSDLDKADAIEPTGWFRWLYFHFFQRYPQPNHALTRELERMGLRKFADDFSAWWTSHSELTVSIVTRHAWAMGTMGKIEIVEKCWDRLPPKSRGAFLAGLSENSEKQEQKDWIASHLNDVSFSAVSVCQLACNSLRLFNETVLEVLWQAEVDWNAPVTRGYWDGADHPEWKDILPQLSNRLIDLVLEAAILCDKPHHAHLALEKEADANIPMWRLERSYNEQYSGLSYAISEGRFAMVTTLLNAGADPRGTTFGTKDTPLYYALLSDNDDAVDQLLALGATFTPATPRTAAEVEALGLYRHSVISEETIDWAKTALSSLIQLTDFREKAVFHRANAQGGYFETFLQTLLTRDKIEKLIKYEALLDTRLTAEELGTAVDWNAQKCLLHLLSRYGEATSEVLRIIQEREPDFGRSQH